ncbi:MAG: DNRLRE domain-containing protein [Candidatus Eisenbacteria sp.]|nr:DNRLRE domain-containing protein [Candidatus Eisenbacteria bacterium]
MQSASIAQTLIIVLGLAMAVVAPASSATIVDHTTADIWQIPDSAIEQAKATLHIAYGHTSHGSQIISGMGTNQGDQLDTFMTNNGATPDMYLWNGGGTGGALDLRDTPFSGASDLGNPDRYAWEVATRNYLAGHPDCNVIIWSWCGQASTSIANIDIYLNLMEGLITDYPDVAFVFMTGHLDGGGETSILNLANEHIRNHCITYDRILYDFADIESYDPDHLVNYMPLLCNDNCAYDSDGNGSRDRNWALDWQGSHDEGVDWWPSGAAHSQHLNGNLKGYAAWWLWATLAGWNQCVESPSDLTADADPLAQEITLNWTDNSGATNEDSFIIQRQVNGGAWDDGFDTVGPDVTTYVDAGLALGTYSYRVVAHLNDDGTGNPCDSAPSNTATAVMTSAEPPAAPTDLAAIADSQDRTISLTWVDNASNEDGYIVQRRVGTGPWDDAYDDTLPEDATAYVDPDLAPDTYTYRIVAYNDFGPSPASNEAAAAIVDIPPAPSDLAAEGDSPAGTVTLTWIDNADSEDEFIIQRQVDGGAWNDSYDTVGPDIAIYLDDNLGGGPLPNGTYTYRVVAANAHGQSNPSNEASAVISQSAPAAPTDLASKLNGYDISLTWTDQSTNEESFILERSVDGGDFGVWATLPADTEDYLDAGLAPEHTYAYRVKAHNNFGDSDYSNQTSEYVAEETYFVVLKQSVDGYDGCRDAYLDAQYPTYNYGGDLYNYVENDPKCNFAIAFDLPVEVMGMIIVEARIGFYCWTVSSWEEGQYLDLYRLTEEWQEGTADGSYQEGCASWNVRSGDLEGDIAWTIPGGTHDPVLLDSSLIPNAAYYPEFDITDLVQEWANQSSDNLGVLLVNDSATRTGIKASEYSEYGRPYLEITYTYSSSVSPDLPGQLGLARLASYPNPASPNTALRFELREARDLQLSIYSIDGRRVATLMNGPLGAGTHEVSWHGVDDQGKALEAGIYFARLRAGRTNQTTKILLTQ